MDGLRRSARCNYPEKELGLLGQRSLVVERVSASVTQSSFRYTIRKDKNQKKSKRNKKQKNKTEKTKNRKSIKKWRSIWLIKGGLVLGFGLSNHFMVSLLLKKKNQQTAFFKYMRSVLAAS